jgi:hypothetical protein
MHQQHGFTWTALARHNVSVSVCAWWIEAPLDGNHGRLIAFCCGPNGYLWFARNGYTICVATDRSVAVATSTVHSQHHRGNPWRTEDVKFCVLGIFIHLESVQRRRDALILLLLWHRVIAELYVTQNIIACRSATNGRLLVGLGTIIADPLWRTKLLLDADRV